MTVHVGRQDLLHFEQLNLGHLENTPRHEHSGIRGRVEKRMTSRSGTALDGNALSVHTHMSK